MGVLQLNFHRQFVLPQNLFLSQHCRFRLSGAHGLGKSIIESQRKAKRRRDLTIFASSSVSAWDGWLPEKAAAASKAPSLSDIFWPSAGAFAAMAILGKIDQMLAPKGVSITIAPLGAVCAVLFATPSSPGARHGQEFYGEASAAEAEAANAVWKAAQAASITPEETFVSNDNSQAAETTSDGSDGEVDVRLHPRAVVVAKEAVGTW